MKTSWRPVALVLITGLVAAGCEDSSTDPEVAPCTPETVSVEANITVKGTITIDWAPRCAVAALGVEVLGGEDRWWISSPSAALPQASDSANTIRPPVTYGVAPAGASGAPALPLTPGVTHQLALWRAVPKSVVQAGMRCGEGNGPMVFCLMPTKTFTP